MKSFTIAALAAFWAGEAAAHATFQDLWVNGVDYGGQCARVPASNSPITDVTSNSIRCNVGTTSPTAKCPVKAGDTVTVEMHQQPGDRSCATEAIGGEHWGPVQVYMSKVDNAVTADGSSGWFKVFADTWAKNPSGAVGDDDYWGTKDLNTCCGRMDVKIPADLPSGDYLLRAEVIALHVASSSGGAQFYMSCYQLAVTGSGSASPSTVLLPGAYKASDPGILVNIHAAMSTYVMPGPTVYAGGSTKSAGSGCVGCESTCTPGAGPSPTLSSGSGTGSGSSQGGTTATPTSSAAAHTSTAASAPGGGGTSGCSVAKYGQCGGTGFSGCGTCASGSTCSAVSPPYYSQCL